MLIKTNVPVVTDLPDSEHWRSWRGPPAGPSQCCWSWPRCPAAPASGCAPGSAPPSARASGTPSKEPPSQPKAQNFWNPLLLTNSTSSLTRIHAKRGRTVVACMWTSFFLRLLWGIEFPHASSRFTPWSSPLPSFSLLFCSLVALQAVTDLLQLILLISTAGCSVS